MTDPAIGRVTGNVVKSGFENEEKLNLFDEFFLFFFQNEVKLLFFDDIRLPKSLAFSVVAWGC